MKEAETLLKLLECNFEAEGKRSCRDCLRSKAVPSPCVEEAFKLPNLLSPPVILEVHTLLLTETCKTLADCNQNDKGPSSALSRINCVATILRFVQLLLCIPRQEQALRDPSQICHSSPSITIDQIDQLVNALLPSCVKSLTDLLTWSRHQNCDTHEDADPFTMDSSISSDLRPVLIFSFSSLLRLQHLCQSRQQWMVPMCKGITDLAAASHKANVALPLSLLEDALRTLSKVLEEGTLVLVNAAASLMKSQDSPIPMDYTTFLSRFLSFLVVRVATLLPILISYPAYVSPNSLWKTLSILRGLSLAVVTWITNNNETKMPFVEEFDAMASKVEKHWIKLLGLTQNRKHGSTEGENFSVLLKAVLSMKVPHKKKKRVANTTHTAMDTATLLRDSCVVGRALLLQRVLHVLSSMDMTPTSLSMADIDSILRLCESYQSLVLPQCFGLLSVASHSSSYCNGRSTATLKTLISDTLPLMATLLLRVQSLMESTKRAQLHRLMIRWMTANVQSTTTTQSAAPNLHPLSREFTNWLVSIYAASSSMQDQPSPIVPLMVKLIFDPRTCFELRHNLTAVVLLLLTSSHSTHIHNYVNALIQDEYTNMWKQLNTTSKKRKRHRSEGQLTIRKFHPRDIVTVVHILAGTSLTGGISKVVTPDTIQSVMGLPWRSRFSIRRSTLLLGCLQGVGIEQISTKAIVPEFHKDLISKVLTILELSHKTEDKHSLECLVLCMTYLRFVESLSENSTRLGVTTVSLPIIQLCQLVSRCTSTTFLQTTATSPKYAKETSKLRRSVFFQAIQILGSLGSVITDECPVEVIQVVREIFTNLFSLDDVSILRSTVEALIDFGRAIPCVHSKALPTFLPKKRLPLFQARNQGLIWDGTQHQRVDESPVTIQSVSLMMDRHIRQREIGKSILPTLTSYTIAPGSYFLQMPTQEGRKALVIFPPGEQSMEDIRLMYELQDDEDSPPVQILKRTVLPRNSGEVGCKCVLASK